jgi:hypothetical protein
MTITPSPFHASTDLRSMAVDLARGEAVGGFAA